MTSGGPATSRYVEHVMGMPISLALRGRHADDERGRAAWAEAVAALRDVDRVFSTWREDSWVSRLGRDEVTLADCPPEVAEVLALGDAARAQSQGAFDVHATEHEPTGVVVAERVDVVAQPDPDHRPGPTKFSGSGTSVVPESRNLGVEGRITMSPAGPRRS